MNPSCDIDMIRRFQIFLGPVRVRAIMLLLGVTGLISLALNAVVDNYDWARPVQSLMVLAFVVGAAIIIGGRMRREDQLRWAAILTPSLGLIALGVVFLPDMLPLLTGGALGWVAAGIFIFRGKMPVEYRAAVKHLRKSEYEEAVKIMDKLIQAEPNESGHYRFRAEILRLWGKLESARSDYQKMIELSPDSAVAYNGMAEVCLQEGDYTPAREAALRAYELAPDEWVASYNLGMIEDRMREASDAIEHLTIALSKKVPDARHRLLIHLYLARAYSRMGDLESARKEVEAIRREKNGLEEWQLILESDQAATLRAVLADDVQSAQDLLNEQLDVAALADKGE